MWGVQEQAPRRVNPCRICLHKGSCDTYFLLNQVEENKVLEVEDDNITLEWCEVQNGRLQIMLHCQRFEEDIDAT